MPRSLSRSPEATHAIQRLKEPSHPLLCLNHDPDINSLSMLMLLQQAWVLCPLRAVGESSPSPSMCLLLQETHPCRAQLWHRKPRASRDKTGSHIFQYVLVFQKVSIYWQQLQFLYIYCMYDGRKNSDRPRTIIFRVLRWHDRSEILKGARQLSATEATERLRRSFFPQAIRLLNSNSALTSLINHSQSVRYSHSLFSTSYWQCHLHTSLSVFWYLIFYFLFFEIAATCQPCTTYLHIPLLYSHAYLNI